jgi:hypothetical protein
MRLLSNSHSLYQTQRGSNRVLGISALAVSPGGDEIFFGLNELDNPVTGIADQLVSVRTSDWSDLHSVSTDSFSWFALTPDGSEAFLVNSSTGEVGAVDTQKDEFLGSLGHLGDRPQKIYVMP